MKHFETWQWADFSRGLDSGIDRSLMQSHLETCAKCRRTVGILSEVAAVAAAEPANTPPRESVRLAKAIYTPPPSQRLLARLIFDSFLAPLPVGVRTQDRQTRQAVYEAGSYCVDVRVEHQPRRGTTTLVGQLADRDHPGANAADVSVLLKTKQKTIASAPCDEFGEFYLEYRPAPSLRLDVCLGDSGRVLELPLSELMDESAPR
jgi:hypothetical protein